MTTHTSFILLFGISGGEIIVIFLLVLLLFGPKKIPEIAKALGKGMNEIKKVQRDINAEIHRYSQELEKPARQITEDIEGYKKGLDEQIADTLDEKKPEPDKKSDPNDTYGYPYVDNSRSNDQQAGPEYEKPQNKDIENHEGKSN
jgi:TatA/E family protein of Tat protein translocase